MTPMTRDDLPEGNLEDLEYLFTTVVADGEDGIFAIGIDATDPDFPEGSATMFSGDDGHFRPSSPRFSAASLVSLLAVLKEANEQVGQLCVSSKGRFVLRARSAQEVPDVMPLDTELRAHRGFLAANEQFCALVAPYGDNLHQVALHLMMADHRSGVWMTVKRCHVYWLPTLSSVADRLPQREPGSSSAPASPGC